MAENKKGFVLYADQKDLFTDLTDEEAGILIKHIFCYVNDESPILENRLIKVAFNPIKFQLKRDLKKYELVREKRSIAGLKSAELKKQNSTKSTSVESVEQNQQVLNSFNKPQQTSTNSTVIDNVNVIVNDTVTVNVTDTVKDINITASPKNEIFYFRIRNNLIEKKLSEYISTNFASFIEVQQRSFKVSDLTEFYKTIDDGYFGYDFNNENHIQNTIKSVFKKINESQKNGNKDNFNERKASVVALSKLANGVLQGFKLNDDTAGT